VDTYTAIKKIKTFCLYLFFFGLLSM